MSPRNILGFPFFRSKASLCVLNAFLPANMKCLSPYQRNCKPALSGKTEKKSQKKSQTLVDSWWIKIIHSKIIWFSYPVLSHACLVGTHPPSMGSKRFRLVSEQRKTDPRSLLRNRTQTYVLWLCYPHYPRGGEFNSIVVNRNILWGIKPPPL